MPTRHQLEAEHRAAMEARDQALRDLNGVREARDRAIHDLRELQGKYGELQTRVDFHKHLARIVNRKKKRRRR